MASQLAPSFPKPLFVGVVSLALVLTTALYVVDLEHSPVSLGGDEAQFAVNGHALATTGRDLSGTSLPLFFNLRDPLGDITVQERFHAWYQPLLFYLIAIALKVLPLTEASVRLPSAIIGGLLSPWLMYVVAMRLLRDRWLALFAMLVLALSPPVFILSRQALDYVCPLPFVLGWLWCLVTFLERGGLWRAFVGGLLLGVGFYSYIASWIFMPACLVMTWVAYFRSRPDAGRASAVATMGFILPLGLLVPWAWFHPEMFRETVERYLSHGVGQLTVAQGARNFLSLSSLRQKFETYVSYADPNFLFVRGAVSLTMSTGRSGVFLLPVAVFLGVGLFDLAKRARREAIAMVLLGGLLLAPVPAALVNESRMIQREIFMLPFAAAIAAYGAAVLFRQPRGPARTMAAVLLVAIPLQFGFVCRDYFTHYKNRSAFYYDSVVFGAVANVLVASDPPAILLSHELNDAGPKWRFYAAKHGRSDLLSRTSYVDESGPEVTRAPLGSLLVVYASGLTMERLTKDGEWSLERLIDDVDHRPASVVLKKGR